MSSQYTGRFHENNCISTQFMLSLTCSFIFNNLGCHLAEKHPLNLLWLAPAKGALRFSVYFSKRVAHLIARRFLFAKIQASAHNNCTLPDIK